MYGDEPVFRSKRVRTLNWSSIGVGITIFILALVMPWMIGFKIAVGGLFLALACFGVGSNNPRSEWHFLHIAANVLLPSSIGLALVQAIKWCYMYLLGQL